MNTQITFKARAFQGDSDLQKVVELLNLAELHDDLDDGLTTPESLRTRLNEPTTVVERDVRLWNGEDDALVGFAQISLFDSGEEAMTDARLAIRIHPDVRNQGLEEEVLGWAEKQVLSVAEARGQTGRIFASVRGNSPEYAAYLQEVLDRNGYTPARYWFKMARNLSEPMANPQLPEGYILRHTEGAAEAGKWVDAFNLSFVDHWNHHEETPERHRYFLENEADYVKERDLVAIAPDGTWAAFCFCWISPKDNAAHNRKEGWIDVLGTCRGYRKMGLGTAILYAGMHKLKEDGMDTAVLAVDADNPTGALRLYESVGFYKVSSSTTYEKRIA